MNISVKKFSKKSLSLLIALIMIISALPFSPLSSPIEAEAATEVILSNDRHGLITQGSDSRQKNNYSQYQIVNDQEKNNTNAGVLHFDLSEYSDKRIESVTFNAKIDTPTGDNQIPYMNFYYSSTLNGKDSTYLTPGGKETKNVNNTFAGYGTGTTANEKYLNHLIGHYDEDNDRLFQIASSDTSSKQVDVTDKIKQIILSGKTDLYIIVMHSNAGGSGRGSGWSDALISPANINFTVTYSDYDFSNPTQAKEYVDERINVLSRTYTNVYTSNADSTFMNGVISGTGWSDPTAITINDYDSNTSNSISLKIHGLSNSVAIYTGNSSDIRFPVIFENSGYNDASNVNTYISIDHVSLSSGNFALSGNNWDRCSSWNDLTYNSESTFTFYSTSDGNFSREAANSTNKFRSNNIKTWRNYIKYTGSGNTSSYYDKLTSATFNFQADIALNWKTGLNWGGWGTGTKGRNYNRDLTYPLGLYVLNYKPLNDIIVSSDFKNNYNNISQNSWKYTPEGLANYYAVVADILAFNLVNESMTSESEISAVAGKIKDLVTRYNSYKSPQRKSLTITFNRNDKSTEIKNILAGDSIGTLPTNSSATHIEGTDTHNGYVWSGVTSATVPQSNTNYTEVPAVVNCSGGTATCTQKAICSQCNAEYGSLAQHSFVTDFITGLINKEKAPEGDNNGYTYQGCVNCDAEDPSRVAYRKYYDQSEFWNTYKSLLAQANDKIAENEASNGMKYNSDTINALNEAIARVTEVGDKTKSQTYIENENTILQTAITALKLNQYSITVKYVDETGADLKVGENGATSKTYPAVNYGSIQNVVAPTSYDGKEYIVYKWTRDSQGNNTISGLNSSSLGVVVKGNLTYYVYLKNATVDSSTANTTAIVKLNNKSNKVVDVGYVNQGTHTVTVSENSFTLTEKTDNNPTTVTLTAPNYSFYTVKGFTVNGKTVTSGSTVQIDAETVIKPVYTPKDTITITVGSGVAGGNVSTSWDSRVKLTSTLKPTDSQIIKWTANIDGTDFVWGYGETLSFQATQSCTVSCELISKDKATPSVSVDYVSYNLYKANTITAVSRIAVPDGYMVVEYGTILKTSNNLNSATPSLSAVENATYSKTNSGGVFKATQQITGTNQFAVNFFAATEYNEMYVGAVAYLVYKEPNSNTELTVYSNSNGGKVITSSYNKSAVGN